MIRQKKTPGCEPRVIADHSGASSVASTLGIRSGATPCGHHDHNIHSRFQPSGQDISTWQRIGHFYLALTAVLLEQAVIEKQRERSTVITLCRKVVDR